MSTHDTRRVPPRFGRSRAFAWSGLLVVGLLSVPVLGGGSGGVSDVEAAAACPAATYTVVSGDSWSRIASRSGVTLSALLQANNATATKVIHPGDVLCLPTGATNPASSTTTTSPASTLPPGAISIAQFPVQGLCWFTDSFGAPRSGGRRHEGVDILAAQGNKVYAVADGVLTKQYIDSPGLLAGNGWRLTKPDGTYFFYAHLSAFAPGLSVGSTVKAGQILGLIGMTGNAGSPHLHFEVHPGGGAAINPTPTITAVNGCKTTKVPPQPTAPTTTTPPSGAGTTAPPVTVKGSPASTPTTSSTTTTAPPTTTTTAPPLKVTSGLWQFIAPAVAHDGMLPAGTPTQLDVTRLAGVAAGTPGVMVRVTVRKASISGYLAAYPCAGGVPATSTLNFAAGRVNAGMSLVGVSDGKICVLVTSAVDARVEVVGFAGTSGVGVVPMASRRAIDTRTTNTPLAAGSSTAIVPAALGAPRGTKAVTVTVTLLSPAAAGEFSIGPCGGTPWKLAYTTAAAQEFSAIVRVNDAGLCVGATSAVHVFVDVTGVWAGSMPLGVTAPTRVYDSRSATQITTTPRSITVPLPPGAARAQFTLALLGGAASSLFVWNCAQPKPSSSVAYTNGGTVSATVTVDIRGGKLCLASSGSAHAVVDLTAVG